MSTENRAVLHVIAICVPPARRAARWGLACGSTRRSLPWGTLAVNLIGGYLVGLAIATFKALPDIDPAWRLLVITGFLGR